MEPGFTNTNNIIAMNSLFKFLNFINKTIGISIETLGSSNTASMPIYLQIVVIISQL